MFPVVSCQKLEDNQLTVLRFKFTGETRTDTSGQKSKCRGHRIAYNKLQGLWRASTDGMISVSLP